MSDVLPQHDLDERKRLGREIGLENARREQYQAHEIRWGGITYQLTLPELQRFLDAKYSAIRAAYDATYALEAALI